MARIKKEAETLINDPLEAIEEKESPIDESTIEQHQNGEAAEPAPLIIPDNIDRVLKMYPTYEELYIDNKGGTYTSQHPNTNLYQNPYYKQ